MPKLSASAKLFICLVMAAGLASLVAGLVRWECKDLVRFFSFLVVAAVASRLKVTLPGINGNMSVNLPFLLIAMVELSLGEAVVIAAVSTLVQSLPTGQRKMQPVQVLFNTSTLVISVGCGALAFLRGAQYTTVAQKSLLMALAGAAYLLANTLPVATVISLTEGKSAMKVWYDIFSLTFPYFGFGAALAAITVTATHYIGWHTPLFVAPLMFITYHSFRKYFSARATGTQKFHAAAAAD